MRLIQQSGLDTRTSGIVLCRLSVWRFTAGNARLTREARFVKAFLSEQKGFSLFFQDVTQMCICQGKLLVHSRAMCIHAVVTNLICSCY